MNRKFSPHLELSRSFWRSFLAPNDLAIDATLGNGHDTLFLRELGAEVIGLDIQQDALEMSKKLLDGKGALLLHKSHAELDSLPLERKPKLIVYNLGYLPGGDKSLTTRVESTLVSLNQSIEILDSKGALSITCYPGHDEGQKEEEAILKWAATLPAQEWSVCHHRWLNRARSPSFLWIVSHRP